MSGRHLGVCVVLSLAGMLTASATAQAAGERWVQPRSGGCVDSTRGGCASGPRGIPSGDRDQLDVFVAPNLRLFTFRSADGTLAFVRSAPRTGALRQPAGKTGCQVPMGRRGCETLPDQARYGTLVITPDGRSGFVFGSETVEDSAGGESTVLTVRAFRRDPRSGLLAGV